LPEVSRDSSIPVMCGSETLRLLEKFFIVIFFGGDVETLALIILLQSHVKLKASLVNISDVHQTF
jgi:hypothetical protein